MTTCQVWLTGERFDVAYLLDTRGGAIRRFEQRGVDVGRTAGFMERIVGGRRVGWYVSPADGGLHLRLGRRDLATGDVVGSTVSHGPARLWTKLDLTMEHGGTEALRKLTPARAALRGVDPAYDELDEFADDFLAQMGELVASPEAQQRVLDTTDPRSGPWHLVGSSL